MWRRRQGGRSPGRSQRTPLDATDDAFTRAAKEGGHEDVHQGAPRASKDGAHGGARAHATPAATPPAPVLPTASALQPAVVPLAAMPLVDPAVAAGSRADLPPSRGSASSAASVREQRLHERWLERERRRPPSAMTPASAVPPPSSKAPTLAGPLVNALGPSGGVHSGRGEGRGGARDALHDRSGAGMAAVLAGADSAAETAPPTPPQLTASSLSQPASSAAVTAASTVASSLPPGVSLPAEQREWTAEELEAYVLAQQMRRMQPSADAQRAMRLAAGSVPTPPLRPGSAASSITSGSRPSSAQSSRASGVPVAQTPQAEHLHRLRHERVAQLLGPPTTPLHPIAERGAAGQPPSQQAARRYDIITGAYR